MSINQQVSHRVARMKRGVPFSIESFYALGSTTSVQKAMSRLTQLGELIRVSKGIYTRPKPLANIPSIKLSAKAEDVAKTWAKTRKHKLAPQGLESAYRLGMQTQAPVKKVFWTTGPNREFNVGNETVIVKHTTVAKLKWISKPEGELFRGLLTLSAEHTSLSTLKTAFKRLQLSRSESVEVINKLMTTPLLSAWKPLLIQLKSSILS